MLDTTKITPPQDVNAGSGGADILPKSQDPVNPLGDKTLPPHRSAGPNIEETSSQERFPTTPKLGARRKRKEHRGKEDYFCPSNRDCRKAYEYSIEAKPDSHKKRRVSLPEDCYLFLQALHIRSRLDVGYILVGLIKKAVNWNVLKAEYHARKK